MHKKKLIINSASVKIAGGLHVTLALIDFLTQNEKYQTLVICPKIREYLDFESQGTSVKQLPDILLLKPFRLILDYIIIPRIIANFHPDLVISTGNLPTRTKIKQVFLHDNPYVTLSEYSSIPLSISQRLIHRIRVAISIRRINQFATEVWTQTNNDLENLKRIINPSISLKRVYPLIPFYLFKSSESLNLPQKKENVIRLICLARYFEHKNLLALLDCLKLENKQNPKIQILFTIDKKHGSHASVFFKQLKSIPNDNAINLGFLPVKKIKKVIQECDGVILPSLLETFGLNCLEAWYCQKPYFASDLSVLREICGEAAVFFNPNNPEDILKKIVQTFQNKELITRLVHAGTEKIKNWPARDETDHSISKLLET